MWLLVIGLFIYALVFAVNSAMHSYLIVSYAKQSGVSLDVGFYYMANASGRLVGTLLSGWVFQMHGLAACLVLSSVMVVLATMMTKWLQAVETA
jgi:predicted MFS family arabinose efflux permease